MEKSLAYIAFATIILLVSPLIGTVSGAFIGWFVGLLFANTIQAFFAAIGVNVAGLAIWQIGAALGFIGGFFRPAIIRNGTK